MRVYYMSDLHFEFEETKKWPYNSTNREKTVLLLCGDIFTAKNYREVLTTVYNNSMFYDIVLMIAGNHEFYMGDFETQVQIYKDYIEEMGYSDKIKYLDNEVYVYEGVNFIASTLWSDFEGGSLSSKNFCKWNINDFRLINDFDGKLTPDVVYNKFQKNVDFIIENLNKFRNQRNVVLTHNPPTYQCVEEIFKYSDLNGSFVSDLEYIIKEYDIDYWICGHVHSNHNLMIHDTNVLCNSKGYYDENKDFKNTNFFVI